MCNLKERKKKGRMEEVEEGRKGRKEGKKKRDTEKENEKKNWEELDQECPFFVACPLFSWHPIYS